MTPVSRKPAGPRPLAARQNSTDSMGSSGSNSTTTSSNRSRRSSTSLDMLKKKRGSASWKLTKRKVLNIVDGTPHDDPYDADDSSREAISSGSRPRASLRHLLEPTQKELVQVADPRQDKGPIAEQLLRDQSKNSLEEAVHRHGTPTHRVGEDSKLASPPSEPQARDAGSGARRAPKAATRPSRPVTQHRAARNQLLTRLKSMYFEHLDARAANRLRDIRLA
jgi:hypothetical protein